MSVLVAGTFQRWRLLVSGAGLSALAWLFFVARIQGVSWRHFALACLAVVLVAMFLAFHDVRVERDGLRDALKPKFEIVFKPADGAAENRPYLHIYKMPRQKVGDSQREVTDRRYRVGIRNLSSAVVPNVQVILASCEPGGNWIHPGHRLQMMDEPVCQMHTTCRLQM